MPSRSSRLGVAALSLAAIGLGEYFLDEMIQEAQI